MILKDKNGLSPEIGDIVKGLYSSGDDRGMVILDHGVMSVVDSDGDVLELESVFASGAYIVKQSNSYYEKIK